MTIMWTGNWKWGEGTHFLQLNFHGVICPYCLLLFSVNGPRPEAMLQRIYDIQRSLSSYYSIFLCTVNQCPDSNYEGKKCSVIITHIFKQAPKWTEQLRQISLDHSCCMLEYYIDLWGSNYCSDYGAGRDSFCDLAPIQSRKRRALNSR